MLTYVEQVQALVVVKFLFQLPGGYLLDRRRSVGVLNIEAGTVGCIAHGNRQTVGSLG